MYGRSIRLRRLFPTPGHRLFSVPLDHPVSMGPIDGLERLAPVAEALQRGGAELLIVTKGAVRELAPVLRPSTLVGVHLSASTSIGANANRKMLAGSVPQAVGAGADLVSVQVNFGIPEEPEMLVDLGRVVDEAAPLGVPVLCMAYVKSSASPTPEQLRHAARAVADLGADVVKTSYPGSVEELQRLVASTPVPVLLGGGARRDDESGLLELAHATVSARAGGLCVGRNLFQRASTERLAREVASVLRGPAA